MVTRFISRLSAINFISSNNCVLSRSKYHIFCLNQQFVLNRYISNCSYNFYCMKYSCLNKSDYCNKIKDLNFIVVKKFSTEKPPSESSQVSRVQKLKKAVAEYGTTVMVFHITISLISLGLMYLIVSSGVDVVKILDTLGLSQNEKLSAIAANAGTFAIAYAVHKIFAPVRISITLAATPFIVRYLRKVGILKISKIKQKND